MHKPKGAPAVAQRAVCISSGSWPGAGDGCATPALLPQLYIQSHLQHQGVGVLGHRIIVGEKDKLRGLAAAAQR